MKIKLQNNGEISCKEALLKLKSVYNGFVDPNTNQPLPSYDWRADVQNWPTEIVWQKITQMVFGVSSYIPWDKIWGEQIWAFETVRRRTQELREEGIFIPTSGPIAERREKQLKRQVVK